MLQKTEKGVISCDEGGHITNLNAAARELTGWSNQEARGKPLDEVFLVASDRGDDSLISSVGIFEGVGDVGDTERSTEEVSCFSRDGEVHDIAYIFEPFRDKSGHVVGKVIVFWEVSEERALKRALLERVKELNCLYTLSRIIETPSITLDEILEESVGVIPAGLQFPELTETRVLFEDQCFQTSRFRETPWMLHRDLTDRKSVV